MPKKVDHQQRRLAISAQVEQLVLEKGVEGLTMRDVARAMGCSLSVILHYFDSKLALLVFTHRQVRLRAEAALLRRQSAGAPLRECLENLLPLDEARWRDWHTWLAFFGMSAHSASAAEENTAALNASAEVFARLIRREQTEGRLPPALSPEALAVALQIQINGIASLVAQDRAAWPAARQLATFGALFAALTQG